MFISLDLTDPHSRDVLELTVPSPEGGLQCVIERFITGPGSRRPTPVPDGAIDSVRALLAPNGCYYEDGMPGDARIGAGDELRVLDGPLAGHAAICDMSDGRRVEMLTTLFNRDNVRVSARLSAVEMVLGLAKRHAKPMAA